MGNSMLQFVRSINGVPFQPMFDADKGGGGGGNEGGGEGGSGEGGENGGEGGNDGAGDPNSLDELLKDPTFKAEYQKKLESQLAQRLKNYEGVDPKEYKRLKEEDDKKKRDEETETERLQRERDAALAIAAKAEKSEKRVAIKEHAIDNGYDSKLVARLMETELDSIELKDGKYEGIAEAIDKLAEEFPQIKAQAGDDEGDDEKGGNNNRYNAGDSRRRQNQNPTPNKYNRGAERAKARHAANTSK